jgi:phosphoribosylaminoimidazolecarboxamide formyltransferase/IMP cyclohydrolase
MLRAAAKNYHAVTILVDIDDYDPIVEQLRNHGTTTLETRLELAKKVFAHTAAYDAAIANYLGTLLPDGEKIKFPETLTLQFRKKQDLRYGENPHQSAAFYIEKNFSGTSIATSQQLQGKELSFNNIADADAALECVRSFQEHPACVIVKHANPCGVGLGNTLVEAYQKAFTTDTMSAFGGIIACNQTLDAETAKTIITNQFVEVIIAPGVEHSAQEILKQKPAIRVLSCNPFSALKSDLDFKRIVGGLLVQDRDIKTVKKTDFKVVTERAPLPTELNDLLFAWTVAKFVKSNAIVLARDAATLGIGAGQMSRVDSVQIAITKAHQASFSTTGSVMASDAFFPFRDSIDFAAKAGITAIVQPGGSIRDEEIIQAANEAKIAMMFTGIRHFHH